MTSEIFSANFPLWVCAWQSTVFVVVGLVASFILGRRSSRAHQVLLLSMIAAVIVPIASILVKHYELGVFAAKPTAIKSQDERWVMSDNREATGIVAAEEPQRQAAPIEEVVSSSASVSRDPEFPWRFVALCGWIAASSILAVRLLVSFMLGVHLLGRALPLDCEIIEQAVHLAKVRLGINRDVQVLSSSRDVRSPVIWCWRRRPVLLVPSAAGQGDGRIDWTGVLCHELAHCKRRDHISGLLAELAVCMLPWHLLLWLAKSRLIHLSEQACDDWVLATGHSGPEYTESLLNLAPGGRMAFVPAVVSTKKGLGGRVRRILQDQCANPRSGFRWSLAAAAITGCIAVGVAFAQTRASVQPSTAQSKNMPPMGLAEPEKPKDMKSEAIVLHLVDSDGRPISGAKVGTNVSTRDVSILGSKLSWFLPSKENNVSNESGEIKLTLKSLFPAAWPPDRKAVLYVLHEDQKIGAVCEMSRDNQQQEIELTLEPVCHVHGRLSSEVLDKIGRPLTLTHVYMYWDRDSHGVLIHTSHNSKEYRFDFLVPPGQYELNAYGFGEGTSTENAKPRVEVKAGQPELDMGVIDLPPTKLTMLIGKPAPELGPIKAWKNGSPMKLADLRGKLVILHFGGEYPSTNRDLPRLTGLHEEFNETGLVIIGLYNCESMQQLEERFSELSKKHGGESDVPFRLAVDGGKGRVVEGTDWQVPGETYAAYDIKAYPTTVLIDREGKVVETLNLSRAREKLESMLGVKAESERHVWKQRFEQVYRLDDGQILKRIAPPFIPERKEYCANESPGPPERHPEGPAVMIFHWRDSQANLSYTEEHRNFSLGNLVEYILEISIPTLGYAEVKNYSGNPEGSEQLLSIQLPGDWILRNEALPEAKARALEKLVADEFGRHIRVQKRIVERDVIIATGQFKFSPVYSDEEIVMFADEDESVRRKGETVISGTNTMAQFLQELAWLVSVPVIDRAATTEDTIINYRAYLGSPSLHRVKDISEKKDKLRFFLDTLSPQTNLQFEITREPVEVWFITEGKGT
jgi:beta-lactamase regulating signal transducer with metallopeptidase domain/peroxiredoxin